MLGRLLITLMFLGTTMLHSATISSTTIPTLPPKAYKNIIFDLGDVLIRAGLKTAIDDVRSTGISIPENLATRIQNLGQSPEWLEYNRDAITRQQLIQQVVPKYFPLEEERKLAFTVLQEARRKLLLLPESIDFVKRVKSHGYNVYILSNLSTSAHEHIKTFPGFFDLFDGHVFSFQVKTVKPEPEIYQHLLNTYNLNPHECLFIDDLEVNIEAGKKLGIDGIVHTSIAQTLELLTQLNIFSSPKKEEPTMQPTLVALPAINIIGIQTRTTNKEEFNPSTARIGNLWQKFWQEKTFEKVPNVQKPNHSYGVYTNYESDFNGAYSLIVGMETKDLNTIPTGMMGVQIPTGRYLVFKNSGPMPQACIDTWMAIWKFFGESKEYQCSFDVNFEKYDQNNGNLVEIYMGIR